MQFKFLVIALLLGVQMSLTVEVNNGNEDGVISVVAPKSRTKRTTNCDCVCGAGEDMGQAEGRSIVASKSRTKRTTTCNCTCGAGSDEGSARGRAAGVGNGKAKGKGTSGVGPVKGVHGPPIQGKSKGDLKGKSIWGDGPKICPFDPEYDPYNDKGSGCHEGYCWSQCHSPSEWCYTTAGRSQDFGYVACTTEDDCCEQWKCAGACTI